MTRNGVINTLNEVTTEKALNHLRLTVVDWYTKPDKQAMLDKIEAKRSIIIKKHIQVHGKEA